jgi:Lysine methyltransferase
MKLPLLPNGAALKLTQADGVLGGRIWPAARALCEFVSTFQFQQQQQQQDTSKLDCLELGAGTGGVGLYVAAALGCKVTLTEHRPPKISVMSSVPYAVDGTLEYTDFHAEPSDRLLHLLQWNVDQNVELFFANNNNNNVPRVMELDWNNKSHSQHVVVASKTQRGFDLILASDVTYEVSLHQSLADTIASLLLRPEHLDSRDNNKDSTNIIPLLQSSSSSSSSSVIPKCLVSHQERLRNLGGQDWQLAEFERALLQAGLVPVQIWSHPVADGSKIHKVSILQIQHQQDSAEASMLRGSPTDLLTP